MSLTIIKAGILDTVQDLGRTGFGNWGINPGGAMDRYATKISNILVGNDVNEAVLEVHFPEPQARLIELKYGRSEISYSMLYGRRDVLSPMSQFRSILSMSSC